MDDVISRQAAMAYPLSWEHYDKEHGDRKFICGVESYREYIESLPSARQWIPCSERLPEKSGKYLVSCKANAYSNITTTAQWQNRYKYWLTTGARSHWRVDAWMPLPEPWRGENNET